VQTTKTSVLGAINMLGLAKRLRIKVLQTSTSEVYGDPAVHPQTETYWGSVNPIGPRSCYDEGKRCAENVPLSDLSLVNLLAVQSLLILAIACSRRLRFFFHASCSSPNSRTAAVQLPESRRSADQVSF
jgi:GDP-D-mannose dehydratase